MSEWKQRRPKNEYTEFDSVTEKLAAIYGVKDIDSFLNPRKSDTYDYRLLNNWDQAVNIILKGIKKGLKIVIFADCDFDGCADTALLYRFLKFFTDNVHIVYVQRSVGHGIEYAVDLVPEDTDLLIIVDSSTNSVEACKEISEKGIETLILDHHEWEGKPNPYATIVNPKMPKCNYPNKEASGTLVTWKIAEALDKQLNTNHSEELKDLAGFSLLSDAMSAFEQENRYYIDYALKNVTNLGIKTLMKELKVDFDKFDSTDYLFKVSPCVTAITRFDQIEIALQLLLSDDEKECKKLSKLLIEANEKRKLMQQEYIEKVADQIYDTDKCIVVVDSAIGKGFNGVVAQALSDKYKRPAIVMGESDGSCAGSFRTYADYNLKGLLKEVPQALYSAGHAEAGGTGCQTTELNDFKHQVNKELKDVEFDDSILYDLEFSIEDIDKQLILDINEFFRISGKHFKPGNIVIKNVFTINKKALGVTQKTLKSELCSPSQTWFVDEEDYESLTPYMASLYFRSDEEYFESFPLHKEIDIIGKLNMNYWKAFRPYPHVKETKQVFIVGTRPSL